MATIDDICEAFGLLYISLHEPSFLKTKDFKSFKERDLLPYIRFFLLGRFGHVHPERSVHLPTTSTGSGRVDFMVEGIPIEFATRIPGDCRASLLPNINSSEVIKLLKYSGRGVLVLFDFSDDPIIDYLEEYRDLPSMGRGNHGKTAFSLAYFWNERGKGLHWDLMNIRP